MLSIEIEISEPLEPEYTSCLALSFASSTSTSDVPSFDAIHDRPRSTEHLPSPPCSHCTGCSTQSPPFLVHLHLILPKDYPRALPSSFSITPTGHFRDSPAGARAAIMPRYKRTAETAQLEKALEPTIAPETQEMRATLRNMWEFASLMQYIFLFGHVVKIDDDLDIEVRDTLETRRL